MLSSAHVHRGASCDPVGCTANARPVDKLDQQWAAAYHRIGYESVVLSAALAKVRSERVSNRQGGVVPPMTVQRHDSLRPQIERTFTAVRAALPGANVAAFDAELEAITRAPVVDLAALDDFLSSWWRIATRAAADPADWQRMHEEAEQIQSGGRTAGPTLVEVLARRGVQL